MPEPIWIDCEGSGCRPTQIGTCQMCGEWFPMDVDLTLVAHRRKDVLAMVDRGDFDP